MNIVVKARHMDISDDLRQRVELKAEKLSRYFDELQTVEVILDTEADKPLVEIIAIARRKTTFVATAREDDMISCIDQCVRKISEQIRRHKGKVHDSHGKVHGETVGAEDE